MCRQAAWSFPPDATSPAAARHAVRDELATVVVAGPPGDALIQDTTLVVSELVSNAVLAGSRSIDIGLTIHRSHLLLTVSDDAPGRPRLATPEPFNPRGRGLQVVDSLARAWTVHSNDNGKTVQVEITAHPPAIGALLCDLSTA